MRACINRLAGDGTTKMEGEMAVVAVKDMRRIAGRERQGNTSTAMIEINYRRVRLLPPFRRT